ncbi:MAG: carnosine N-methyltransferase family protein [Bdellovibrionales bacterium]|nr:carnosine N-methyltransferase family protein [Bdellovibrionales bacterium]
MVDSFLLGKVTCPDCEVVLVSKAGQFCCKTCHTLFPEVSGIPFLFSHPDVALYEWKQKIDYQIQLMGNQASQLELLSNQRSDLLSRKRWDLLHQGLLHNQSCLKEIMASFLKKSPLQLKHHEALKSSLPLQQHLMGYYTNLHRDWCWGDEENKISLDLIMDLNSSRNLGHVLILGSGASRLAYDLSLQVQSDQIIVALDINPLLLLFGKKMSSGASLEFYEFPIAPLSLDLVAVKGVCGGVTPAPQNLIWMLADGMNLPFLAGTFDTVITPWFVDVIPQKLDQMAKRINSVLSDQGQWINFGPYGFLNFPLAQQWSFEEAQEIVKSQGFHLKKEKRAIVPYLQSPHSGQKRTESIWCFLADKIASMEKPSPFYYDPEWIRNVNLPLPGPDYFKQYIFATELQSHIFSKIDGKKSIIDLAQFLAESQGLSPLTAQAALVSFFRQLIVTQ